MQLHHCPRCGRTSVHSILAGTQRRHTHHNSTGAGRKAALLLSLAVPVHYVSSRSSGARSVSNLAVPSQPSVLAVQVVVAGTPNQVAESMKNAEQYREQLEERGLLIVPLPIFNTENDTVQVASPL